ncbi:hypothetical protein DNTS_029972 [Danionella cerebrum]|uniref:non-specific serine/threonine protein kinase n=1 Tax=Danionella cerebrum TaxID=2873325 RepID=A0A553RFY3_9TELE|nr:hypothetical protein DNTS_029972 [Danionella translucida]TRZ01096.1 hypothetical protein DNTS_029972 [Danionella translucida]TRZ01097.1 hypothetical protein DNTS_029972 [Danionella translucida]
MIRGTCLLRITTSLEREGLVESCYHKARRSIRCSLRPIEIQRAHAENCVLSHAAMNSSLKTQRNLKNVRPPCGEEHEDPRDYCKGGYHPVHIEDVFNKRYKVLSKLGWGYFSTVWLCIDLRSGRHVAVKVLKSGVGFTQAGQDELALLRCASSPAICNPLKRQIVQLLDEFKIAGVNGIHILT